MLQHRKWYCMTYYNTDDVFSPAEHSRIFSRERHTSGDWMAHQPWEQHFQSRPSLCLQVDTLFLGECANSFFPPSSGSVFFSQLSEKTRSNLKHKIRLFLESKALCVFVQVPGCYTHTLGHGKPFCSLSKAHVPWDLRNGSLYRTSSPDPLTARFDHSLRRRPSSHGGLSQLVSTLVQCFRLFLFCS